MLQNKLAAAGAQHIFRLDFRHLTLSLSLASRKLLEIENCSIDLYKVSKNYEHFNEKYRPQEEIDKWHFIFKYILDFFFTCIHLHLFA